MPVIHLTKTGKNIRLPVLIVEVRLA